MTGDLRVPAAQYLRMSTEHQQYSLENQSRAIQVYAESHSFAVIQSYSDAAKSGLVLKHRAGLRQLLEDVVSGKAHYRAILVYDISRWGRFQDADESAHYEFLCKSAGVPVHYCAEQFSNDGSLPSLIMKTLKRTMAGEYSRELSEKVLAGQKRLVLLGFKPGGEAGYGLRRMLVSSSGVPKQELAFGERKSIATDRVTYVPGPPNEVEIVKNIYRLFSSGRWSVCGIADKLNADGVPRPGHGKWDFSAVRTILTHPKYTGSVVFGRTSKKLRTPLVRLAKSDWIVRPKGFQPIVDATIFAKAQANYGRRVYKRSDKEMLTGLRRLLASKGRLSWTLIKASSDVMAPGTYRKRFGSLRKAYGLIGYRDARLLASVDTRLRTRALRDKLIAKIVAQFPDVVTIVRPEVNRRVRLKFFNRFYLSILMVRTQLRWKNARRWMVEPVRSERKFTTLLARLDMENRSIYDLHVLPNIDRGRKFQLHDSWLKRGEPLADLSDLLSVIERVRKVRLCSAPLKFRQSGPRFLVHP